MTQLKFRKTPSKTNVVAVVAKERWTDHGAHADMTETFGQQRVALRYRQGQRRVVAHEPDLFAA
jgi:hypothetical protein